MFKFEKKNVYLQSVHQPWIKRGKADMPDGVFRQSKYRK